MVAKVLGQRAAETKPEQTALTARRLAKTDSGQLEWRA